MSTPLPSQSTERQHLPHRFDHFAESSCSDHGVVQSTLTGTQNVYIAKINSALGSNPAILQYVTYLGGSGTDTPVGIGVDGSGRSLRRGHDIVNRFPHQPTAYQTAIETWKHRHPARVRERADTPTASAFLYSTYLSGSGDDIASGMTIDSSGTHLRHRHHHLGEACDHGSVSGEHPCRSRCPSRHFLAPPSSFL